MLEKSVSQLPPLYQSIPGMVAELSHSSIGAVFDAYQYMEKLHPDYPQMITEGVMLMQENLPGALQPLLFEEYCVKGEIGLLQEMFIQGLTSACKADSMVAIEDKLTDRDWALVFSYPYITIGLVQRVVALANNTELPGDAEFLACQRPAGMMVEILDLIGRHPELSEIGYLWLEYLTATQIAIQRRNKAYDINSQEKRGFYETIEGMDTVPTSGTREVERTIEAALRLAQSLGGSISALGQGCGECNRLEKKLLDALRAQGIRVDRFDGVDFRDDIDAKVLAAMGITYHHRNLLDPSLRFDKKFDLGLLPWSLVTDLSVEDYLRLLRRQPDWIRKGGQVLIDTPTAYGPDSYLQIAAAQAMQWGGLDGAVEREFFGLSTRLNVYDQRLQVLYGAWFGLSVMNLPYSSREQYELVSQVRAGTEWLDVNYQSGKDRDPHQYPFYKMSESWVRCGLIYEQVGVKKALNNLGIRHCLLPRILFPGFAVH